MSSAATECLLTPGSGMLQWRMIATTSISESTEFRRRRSARPRSLPRFSQYWVRLHIGKWIWSENVERRHLTLEQIVAFEVGLQGYEDQEAAAKQKKVDAGARGKEGGRAAENSGTYSGNTTRGKKKTLPTNSSEGFSKPPKQKQAPDKRKTIAKDHRRQRAPSAAGDQRTEGRSGTSETGGARREEAGRRCERG